MAGVRSLDIRTTARAASVINQGVRELGLRLKKSDGGAVVFERVRPDVSYPDSGHLMDQLVYTLDNLSQRFDPVKEYLDPKPDGILID